ncbi:MAG: 3-oxoacyl-ACP synthase III [Planctomycetia bacterium]|nr:3-oxoacyl-ACP synthase III [Planctomycetia bacterium]
MKYENVCVEAFTCTLPEEIITTDELEKRLDPLYQRLHLNPGRLELMTGIKERRIWEAGKLPGDQSVQTIKDLLQTTQFDPGRVGALIHASVCRDYQEPATACSVHHRAGLSQNAAVFDISNACLGILSGMSQIANMIELGQIQAGIVVGTESSRTLMETTIKIMNSDTSIDRQKFKKVFASLTIGSGSAAVLLTHRSISRTGNRLLGGVFQANTAECKLCQSELDVSAGGKGNGQLMWTDSETLLHKGVATAKLAFDPFMEELDWAPNEIDAMFCHQVGKAHQNLLMETLQLDNDRNFITLPYLGNTGSTALPTAAALGIESGFAVPGSRIALLGIGSGINVIMFGIEWNTTLPGNCSKSTLDRFRKLNA